MAQNNLIAKNFDRVVVIPDPIQRLSTTSQRTETREVAVLRAGFPAYYYTGVVSRSFGYSPWVLTIVKAGDYSQVEFIELTYSDVVVETITIVIGEASTSSIFYPSPYYVDYPNIGWNGAALSNTSFNGNGEITFTCPTTSTGVVAGLNEYVGRLNSSYSDINHGFILRGGKYQVIEGVNILNGEASFIDTDIFKIQRFEGNVNYYVNDILIRAVATTGVADLFFDVSLYASGDTLANASLVDIPDTQYAIAQDSISTATMSTTGDIAIGDEVFIAAVELLSEASIEIVFTDNLFTQEVLAASFMEVQSPITVNGGGQSAADLPFFDGQAANYVYAEGYASIHPFAGEGGYSGVVINVGVGVNTFSPFTSEATGVNGQLNVPSISEMPPFKGFSADHAYGAAVGSLEAITSLGGEFIPVLNGDAKILTGIGTQGNGVLLESGRHLLTAAHVVEAIVDFSRVEVDFNTHVSISVALPVVKSITIHPQWNANSSEAGYDLAVVEFEDVVDGVILRLPIYKDSDEIGKQFVKTSYSPRVDPETGVVTTGGWDTINNRFDQTTDILNDLYSGVIPLGNQLLYDFDNGSTVNDALGSLYGIAGTGVVNEGTVFSGDSGSASVIDGKIAGITGWGSTIGTPPDVLAGTNGTYGEIISEARVSFFADWIEGIAGLVSAEAVVGFPAIAMEATGTRHDTSRASLGGFTTVVEGYTGGFFETSNLVFELIVEGVNTPVGRAELLFPAAVIESTGITGATGQGDVSYNLHPEVESYGGGCAGLTSFTTTLEADGRLGAVAMASIRLPLIEIKAAGTMFGSGSAVIRVPYIELTHGSACVDGFATKLTAKGGFNCEVL